MKMPKIVYDILAYYSRQLEIVAKSFEARNKVATVSSMAFSNACYAEIRADKHLYDSAVELERMNAVYKLLCLGVSQENVLYLVDHNREREFIRILAIFKSSRN